MYFEPCDYDLGPYQEGNLASIDLVMDESFQMDNVSMTMQVKDKYGNLVVCAFGWGVCLNKFQ